MNVTCTVSVFFSSSSGLSSSDTLSSSSSGSSVTLVVSSSLQMKEDHQNYLKTFNPPLKIKKKTQEKTSFNNVSLKNIKNHQPFFFFKY